MCQGKAQEQNRIYAIHSSNVVAPFKLIPGGNFIAHFLTTLVLIGFLPGGKSRQAECLEGLPNS
jgi:hypothetical protein